MGGDRDFGVRKVSFGTDCGGREVRTGVWKARPGAGGSGMEVTIGLLDGA